MRVISITVGPSKTELQSEAEIGRYIDIKGEEQHDINL